MQLRKRGLKGNIRLTKIVRRWSSRSSRRLDIGLVNNTSDEGEFLNAERQFARLLALPRLNVRLHLFTLDGVTHEPQFRDHIASCYGDLATLERTPLDGLIVTGAARSAPIISDEPYWKGLMRVVDYAEKYTVSTIWLCRAAHRAVLYSDGGVELRRLPQPHFGLFECVVRAHNNLSEDQGCLEGASFHHRLFEGLPAKIPVPFTRWNDVSEIDLRSHAYDIASISGEAGVHCFTKRRGSLFVFLQGHLEYDIERLYRIYGVRALQFLQGERDWLPRVPTGYFNERTEKQIGMFEEEALRCRRLGVWDDFFPKDWGVRRPLVEVWQAAGVQFHRNWLWLVAAMRQVDVSRATQRN